MCTIRFQLLALTMAFVAAAAPASAEPYREECPAGSYLAGFDGFAGDWISQMHIVCAHWDAGHARLKPPVTMEGAVGRSNGGTPVRADCPRGWIAAVTSGLHFEPWRDDAPRVIHSFWLTCRPPSQPPEFKSAYFGSQSRFKTHDDYEKNVIGNASCADGQAPIGIAGEHGEFVFELWLICADGPKASPVAEINVKPGVEYKNAAIGGTKRVGNDITVASPAAEPTPPPPPPQQPKPAKQTATAKADVNIHQDSSGKSPIIGILRNGRTVDVLGHDPEKDWYRLEFKGVPGVPDGPGWVAANWLTISP